ncbi:hypothetical protein PAECIP111893_00360 [Paenibacillus plantiphilus]|uniref:Flagellar protein FliT n=1 Tax=Paenibacillus plantiphilus TaxID=2905650 RepID=A0ABN8FY85_9BACL|nr:hypothetical protein [Paenibacillus plantiphilus]CAH1192955.1 hypothetical protein PAECIP111893_00360 [Paenibacillus plantiphilus]
MGKDDLTKFRAVVDEMKSIMERQNTLIADDMDEEALQKFAVLSEEWDHLARVIDRIRDAAELDIATLMSDSEILLLIKDMNDKVIIMNEKLHRISLQTSIGMESARKQQTAVRSYGGMNSMDYVSLYFDKKQ